MLKQKMSCNSYKRTPKLEAVLCETLFHQERLHGSLENWKGRDEDSVASPVKMNGKWVRPMFFVIVNNGVADYQFVHG